ncbi:MAG: 2-oxo acid dehydrogenase subunit E2 [Proteobacteria bacterium]|nr:2-oxo acid dehydrogenase subunit E2 [Pseudomonadota bacterium]
MAEFYEMPAISPTMEMGTLVEWRVKEGEAFTPQTVLAEVGTDKANMEAEVFDKGVLIKHLIEEGDEVPPGYPIAIVGNAADEDITALLAAFEAKKAEAPADEAPEAAPTPEPTPAPVAAKPAPAPKAPVAMAEKPSLDRMWQGKTLSADFQDPHGDIGYGRVQRRIVASPLARAVAADKGVDLRHVTGTGHGGRITRDDVESAKSAPAGGTGLTRGETKVVRNSPMRKTIAKRLLESHSDIPNFFLTATFDMGAFVGWRTAIKASLPDVRVSYNDMLTACVARALRAHPQVNASWDAKAITQHGQIDIGIAVALPHGLITPVVRDADLKNPAQIGAEIRELAGRAKEGKLSEDEYSNNTFTISNLGMYAIDEFTAIINPPASAILAVGSIQEVPVVENGQLTVGHRMKVTMTCDHRVVDGKVGAEFLKTLRNYVEAPALMLL